MRRQADELARVHASSSETTRTLKAQLVRCQAGLRASAERASAAEEAREPLERRVAELSAQLLAEQQRVADMLVEMAAPKTMTAALPRRRASSATPSTIDGCRSKTTPGLLR